MTETDVRDTYRALREAEGEEYELLQAELNRRIEADPEGVARAIERGELPVG